MRVVADTLSSSSGTRSRSVRMSVPLPTPDGPVMTKTRAIGRDIVACRAAAWGARRVGTRGAPGGPSRVRPGTRLSAQPEHRDGLRALTLRETADRLARRDAALLK